MAKSEVYQQSTLQPSTKTIAALTEFGLYPERYQFLEDIHSGRMYVLPPWKWREIAEEFEERGLIMQKNGVLKLTATGYTLLNAISDMLQGKEPNRSKH